MSNYLSEEVRKCRQKAEDCAQRASTQVDPRLKKDFLELQKSWLFLARSYSFHRKQSDRTVPAERTGVFTLEP